MYQHIYIYISINTYNIHIYMQYIKNIENIDVPKISKISKYRNPDTFQILIYRNCKRNEISKKISKISVDIEISKYFNIRASG